MQLINSSKSRYTKMLFFIVPSFLGMAAFYFVPSLISVVYAFTDSKGAFVWFNNFASVLSSETFHLAARNSLLFIAVSVPLSMVISFLLAGLCQNLKRKKAFAVAFMLPLVIPSGAVAFFWRVVFDDNGLINRLLAMAGMETTYWFATNWVFGIVVLVFILKNIGFNLALFLAGYQLIPREYYEIARVEGAGKFQEFRNVTAVYMFPTTLLVFIMSIINSFKVFREIYILFGSYPHQSIYMLQHYMNNQFAAANLHRLSVVAMIFSLIVFVMILGVLKGTKKKMVFY